MPPHLCVSIRLLGPTFHGRQDRGEPEWPPSPLRVFQALVAAAAARRRTETFPPQARAALTWLEQQPAPNIVAASCVTASGYRLSVPNNAMDIVAKAWCRGNYSGSGDANPAKHRTMKTVRPTLLIDGDAIHYLWPMADSLTDEDREYAETLADVARSIVALGWGIDMAVGHAALVSHEQIRALDGERWLPCSGTTGNGLRRPLQGTFDALIDRHERFLKRLDSDGFTAPPPLTRYATVVYRRETEHPRRPVAAFSLLKPDASGFRSYDTVRRALTVAGMVRHATKTAARLVGRSEEWINTFVLGHAESRGDAEHIAVGTQRFAYLPLPSIEARGQGNARVLGNVRRVILSSYAEDCEADIAWARRALSGRELIDEDNRQPVALLSLIPDDDAMVSNYTREAAAWATVTPVVLPGYDDPAHYRHRLRSGVGAAEQKQLLDRLGHRIDRLLRKGIIQAGFAKALADNAELEWRSAGFWPGSQLANAYGVPDYLRRFPRFHVRIHWRDAQFQPLKVPGPICIGGGRFHGLGLFAAL